MRSIVHLNIMSPAFTITKPEVDFVVDTLRAGIIGVIDDLKRDGTAFAR